MRVSNTSALDGSLVEVVVRWAAGLMEVRAWAREVLVMPFPTGTFKGRCARRGLVRLWVGEAQHFPLGREAYRVGAPEYELADPEEALAAILGHEFGHARQFMAGVARQSEVECERQALWLLTQFRERRGALVVLACEARAKEGARRQMSAAYEAALQASAPARLVEELEEKVREWSTREKRARTWRLKYERRLTAARKSLERGVRP